MDSSIDLQQPVIDGGIRSINFFNGRMLTARDLTREQTANREATRRLGQAVGEGVAYGLELSESPASTTEAPVVAVAAGLAVNRQGQTLWLRDKTDVALVRKASASTAGLIFSECRPLQAGTYVAGAGVYLLTVAPAETREGRAVTSALNSGGASCNTDAVVSAVQFRLIQIDPPITAAELQDENHLRNLIAYKCFGVSDTQSFLKDLFGPELSKYGLLDGLRPNVLTDCDVPLGILYWTLAGGIKFIDMWSVRRRIASSSDDTDWFSLASERRRAEAEAMFFQFQDHVNDLRTKRANPDQIRAVEEFRYLPPVGILPLSTNGFANGVHGDLFFDTLTCHSEVFMEDSRVEALLRAGMNYPPVDLQAPDHPVMLWLYRVRENRQTLVAGVTSSAVQHYSIFSSGHMAFMGDPHFDVNRWDFSNFA
jgi:hypothetical protein